MKTVFVGMSGGVDSSVAALLLKEQGYRVVGIFIRCYNVDGCAERDAEDARRVAEHLGISFYSLDLEEEYKQKVVKYMIDGYRNGLTPNPDVMCNREIKFGLFLKKALAMGADFVATGHYALMKRDRKGSHLFVSADTKKDQTYFLWTLSQEQLRHCLFPVGHLEKESLRKIARKAGLPTAMKKDSQGICFLGQVNLADFLAEYIPPKPGKLISPDGRIMGAHNGAQFLTVGQRHIGGVVSRPKGGEERQPVYVVAKDVKTNTVTIAEGRDNPLLFKREVLLGEVNHLRPMPGVSMPVFARVRYRQPLAEATLHKGSRLMFKEPQQFVAEGQSAVWYSAKGEMLGGGVIIASS